MEGRIVNEWKCNCTPAYSAYLMENGDLLRPGRGIGFTGPDAGGWLQRYTWDGELVWDYSFNTGRLLPHHDVCSMPNGNVLVITSEIVAIGDAIAVGLRPDTAQSQLLPVSILEIKPTGKLTGEIVWQWRSWDHLVQDFDKSKPGFGEVSEHPELIDINFRNTALEQAAESPEEIAKMRALGYVGGGKTSRPRGDAAAPVDEAEEARQRERFGDDAAGVDPGGDAGGGGGGGGRGDWMHVNSIAYNSRFDQIIISVRQFSEVWIIDHSTTTAEAAGHSGGRAGKGGDLLYRWGNPRAYQLGSISDQQFFGQHCAHWIGEGLPGAGNILVFNNGNGRSNEQYSTVDEIVLPNDQHGNFHREEFLGFGPEKPHWSFKASDKSSFFSKLISGAQRLPNGNTFICSGNQGILFEVTPDGQIIWQLKVQGAGSAADGLLRGRRSLRSLRTGIGGIFRSYRYGPGYPGLAGRELKPGRALGEVTTTPMTSLGVSPSAAN